MIFILGHFPPGIVLRRLTIALSAQHKFQQPVCHQQRQIEIDVFGSFRYSPSAFHTTYHMFVVCFRLHGGNYSLFFLIYNHNKMNGNQLTCCHIIIIHSLGARCHSYRRWWGRPRGTILSNPLGLRRKRLMTFECDGEAGMGTSTAGARNNLNNGVVIYRNYC